MNCARRSTQLSGSPGWSCNASKDILPQKQHENLEKVLISAEHLLSLIGAVLDLSKIEAGRMDVRPVEFSLAPLVDLCLRTVEPMVASDASGSSEISNPTSRHW